MRLWYTWLAVNRSPPSSPWTTMTSRRIESRGGVDSAFYQVGDSEGRHRPRWFTGYLRRALDRGPTLSTSRWRQGTLADEGRPRIAAAARGPTPLAPPPVVVP